MKLYIGSTTKNIENADGDSYWEGGHPNIEVLYNYAPSRLENVEMQRPVFEPHIDFTDPIIYSYPMFLYRLNSKERATIFFLNPIVETNIFHIKN